MNVEEAMEPLEEFLKLRVEVAEKGRRSVRSPQQILKEVQRDLELFNSDL